MGKARQSAATKQCAALTAQYHKGQQLLNALMADSRNMEAEVVSRVFHETHAARGLLRTLHADNQRTTRALQNSRARCVDLERAVGYYKVAAGLSLMALVVVACAAVAKDAGLLG